MNSEVRDNSHSTGYSLGYSYDHNANRLTKVVGTGGGAVTTTNTYGTHDQLLTSGSKSYGCDSNGDCTSVMVGTSVFPVRLGTFYGHTEFAGLGPTGKQVIPFSDQGFLVIDNK